MEAFQQFSGSPLGVAPAHLVEPADHHQVLATGQVLVDGGELTGQSYGVPHLVGVGEDIDSGDHRLAPVGLEQGRQDPYGGGFAGSVGAEHSEDGSFGDVEVDAVQCPHITEGLHQSLGVNGAWHRGTPMTWVSSRSNITVGGLCLLCGHLSATGRPGRTGTPQPRYYGDTRYIAMQFSGFRAHRRRGTGVRRRVWGATVYP